MTMPVSNEGIINSKIRIKKAKLEKISRRRKLVDNNGEAKEEPKVEEGEKENVVEWDEEWNQMFIKIE